MHDIIGPEDKANHLEARTLVDSRVCEERGFLDVPQPWDMAVLTYDIREWSEHGLKLEDVKRSLEHTIVEVGGTLRARPLQKGHNFEQSDFLTGLRK